MNVFSVGHALRYVALFLAAIVFLAAPLPGDEPAGKLAAKTAPTAGDGQKGGDALTLHLRKRVETAPKSGRYHAVTEEVRWSARETAIVVCDMWDQHWCRGASARVAELAPRMNDVLVAARERGVLVIHCPSSCLKPYEGTPARKRAQAAKPVAPVRPLQPWCRLDLQREGALPIDDADGGCDCQPACPHGAPWTRQIATLTIDNRDAITDSAEAYYLIRERGIKNVIVLGVHTNMCVLGRPFSIRQLVYQGLNVALMRDLTDTMYNSRAKPHVSHFTGTDYVVEHIETYWCPTLLSTDFARGREFRFREDRRPHVAIVSAEDEYDTETTLPQFARSELGRDYRVSLVFGSERDRNRIPGLDVISQADVLLLSVRRRVLPREELQLVRDYVAAGKPLIGIRTASHAFSLRSGPIPPGHAAWTEFDHDVLGGNYTGHHGGDKTITHPTQVSIIAAAADHVLLRGLPKEPFPSGSWLYKVRPLAKTATPLLQGQVARDANAPAEPVAWTNTARGKIFYTSLGHARDFESPAFRQLLKNALAWATAADKPATDAKPAAEAKPTGKTP